MSHRRVKNKKPTLKSLSRGHQSFNVGLPLKDYTLAPLSRLRSSISLIEKISSHYLVMGHMLSLSGYPVTDRYASVFMLTTNVSSLDSVARIVTVMS